MNTNLSHWGPRITYINTSHVHAEAQTFTDLFVCWCLLKFPRFQCIVRINSKRYIWKFSAPLDSAARLLSVASPIVCCQTLQGAKTLSTNKIKKDRCPCLTCCAHEHGRRGCYFFCRPTICTISKCVSALAGARCKSFCECKITNKFLILKEKLQFFSFEREFTVNYPRINS